MQNIPRTYKESYLFSFPNNNIIDDTDGVYNKEQVIKKYVRAETINKR